MKKFILTTLLMYFVVSAYSQNDETNVHELANLFQKNLREGLDLSSFDSIPDQREKQDQIDAFIQKSQAAGMIAQIDAIKRIENDAREKSSPLSNAEIINIFQEHYKMKISKLKDSYGDYIKEKYNLD